MKATQKKLRIIRILASSASAREAHLASLGMGPRAFFGYSATLATCLAVAGCSETESPSPQSDAPVEASVAELPEAPPSALAGDLFSADEIARYQEIADELGIDWTILAAADSIEGREDSAAAAPDEERAIAIAYTLQALAGAADYSAALAERGGQPYARKVIELSQRLGATDSKRAPTSELPFDPPPGDVIAAYGQKFGILHDGLDIDAPAGQPLPVAGDGVVVSTQQHPVFGLLTCVAHRVSDGSSVVPLTTCYGNQSEISVEPGDQVTRGETIGSVGCTGTCLRPHVHFQVRDGASQNAPTIDPAQYLPAQIAAQAESAGQPLEAQP